MIHALIISPRDCWKHILSVGLQMLWIVRSMDMKHRENRKGPLLIWAIRFIFIPLVENIIFLKIIWWDTVLTINLILFRVSLTTMHHSCFCQYLQTVSWRLMKSALWKPRKKTSAEPYVQDWMEIFL